MTLKSSAARVAARHMTAFPAPTPVDEADGVCHRFHGKLHALSLLLRALHWKASGPEGYGDHLLFEKLYGDIPEEIDGYAERMIKTFGPGFMRGLLNIADDMHSYLEKWGEWDFTPATALRAERDMLADLAGVQAALKSAGLLSVGLDNFLAGVADTHETHLYLLQQRVGDQARQASENLSKDQKRRAWEQLRAKLALLPVTARNGIETWKSADGLIYVVNLVAGQAGVAQNDWEAESFARWMSQGRWIQEPQWDLRRPIKASLAPSAEGHFFDKPRAREVREFAESQAVSNDFGVAAQTVRSQETRSTLRDVRRKVNQSPPTVSEILTEPGASEFSTLNRYVVQTENPSTKGLPEGRGDIDKHPKIVTLAPR